MRLQEICGVKSKVSYRIRKLRESKDLKPGNMAGELNISYSAYSKIERGITDPSVGRLEQIAKILGVGVTYFFLDSGEPAIVEESPALYSVAKKSEVEEINKIIKQLKYEVAVLKKEISAIKISVSKRKK
jgi:transcriptional regulator with XRE-family HTH domain